MGSIGTTWLTSSAQERAQRLTQVMSRRENLYGEFIEEAAKVYSHALISKLDDASNLVHLYALVSKLRLFASTSVISKADDAMQQIIDTYNGPNRDLPGLLSEQDARSLDVLRAFSEACRKEMAL
jgi:hypothetical protein